MSDVKGRTGAAVWFEIPVGDFERGVTFYETLLATTLKRERFGGGRTAVFPYAAPGIGGAVLEAGMLTPGGGGPLVYLNCDGKLDAVIGRIEAAGGRLAGPLIELPAGMGRFVHIHDPDGNRVGLHAQV